MIAVGILAGVIQYLIFAGHPVLSIYPRLIDGALGGGVFAALLLLLNTAASTKYPTTSALATLGLYLASAALSSPVLRSVAPLPELPPPATELGVASALLFIAATARGLYGAYLAASAAPAAALIYIKDFLPRVGDWAGLALAAAGLALIYYVTRPSQG